MRDGPTPGFFGKLPSHGDFIGRGLPRSFTDEWDTWLQHCLAESKAEMGDGWLDAYLVGPIWRFVLSADVCGASTWAGIVFPSVDRVGRYFPLTFAVSVPDDAIPLQLVTSAGEWFADAEQLAWEVLDEEGYDADRLEGAIARLGAIEFGATRIVLTRARGPILSEDPIAIAIADGAAAGQAVLVLAQTLLAERVQGEHSLWWTAGSEKVRSVLLVCRGLPAPRTFVRMLDDTELDPGGEGPIEFALPGAGDAADIADESEAR